MKPMDVVFESPSTEVGQHDVRRASWQRGIGAILMRELTESAFETDLQAHDFSAHDIAIEINSSAPHFKVIKPLWAAAYAASIHSVRKISSDVADKTHRLSLLPAEQGDMLDKDFRVYTYWGRPENTLKEAMDTVAHFPVSLALAICEQARLNVLPHHRFIPETLHDIADLIESPDFTDMFEQSLFAANGFWQGFSTSADGMRATKVDPDESPFVFENSTVRFSDNIIADMRSSVKQANKANKKSLPFPTGAQGSSAGCPARFHRPVVAHEQLPVAQSLATVFGKTTDQLFEHRDDHVADVSRQFIARSLRSANGAATEYLRENVKKRKRAINNRVFT